MKSRKKKKPKEMDAKTLQKKLDELQEQLDGVQKEKDDLFDKLQRVSADYANFQKRMSKQISDSVTYEKENIIKTLLPILDNFEHTLEKSHSAETVDVVLQGVRIVYDQMVSTLAAHGVEQIHALDETFDPSRHEAMLRREEPDKADHAILEEFQKGYQLNGRVIRPSKVIVNRLPGPEMPVPEEEPEEAIPEEAPNEKEDAGQQETDTE